MPFSRVFLPQLLPSQLVLNSWILTPLPVIESEEGITLLLGLSLSWASVGLWLPVFPWHSCDTQGVVSHGRSACVDYSVGTHADATALR